MGDWIAVVPQFVLAVAIMAVPGFAIARCLRFRWWDSVGLSAPLSLGALAVANVVSTSFDLEWTVLTVAVTGGALAALAWAVTAVVGRMRAARLGRGGQWAPEVGEPWSRRQRLIALAATSGAVLIGVAVVGIALGSPDAVNIGHDAAVHVNSINEMAMRHSASPRIFWQMDHPAAQGTFYPPTFSAVAAILVEVGGVNSIVAANLTALAMVVMWPLAASIGIRRFARPSSFGYSVAMLGTVTVTLFPVLLLSWTLWPTAISVLTIGPALVLVARILGLHRAGDGLDDPHGSMSWLACVAATALIGLGMIYSQPGAAFMVLYLTAPLVIWVCWRSATRLVSGRVLRDIVAVASSVAVIGMLVLVIWLTRQVSAVAGIADFSWPTRGNVWDAVRDFFLLTTPLTSANGAFAALIVIGMLRGRHIPRARFLSTCWLIIGLLTVWTVAVQSPFTRFFTGYWYSDPWRIVAVLPTVALPLAALGADTVRAYVRSHLREDTVAVHRRGPRVRVGARAIIVTMVALYILQGGFGLRHGIDSVRSAYGTAAGSLLPPGRQALFERLATEVPAGEAIAGSPWAGAILAGPLSGHPGIYPSFRTGDADRTLLALLFREYAWNPQVCAAVQRLHVGAVVEGRDMWGVNPQLTQEFAGFKRLGRLPGLTLIDAGANTFAYLVGPCDPVNPMPGHVVVPYAFVPPSLWSVQ